MVWSKPMKDLHCRTPLITCRLIRKNLSRNAYLCSADASYDPDQGFILGNAIYGSGKTGDTAGHFAIPMASDTPGTEWHETWLSQAPVQALQYGNYACRHNTEILWGCTAIPVPAKGACAPAVAAAYLELFNLLQASGFPHLWRIWNYIPRINQPNSEGLEMYRDFNFGRAEAFADAYDQGLVQMPWATRHMPAATGIGCDGDSIRLYFLAGRNPGTHVENPRQVAAYRYPADHGPRPPCFARASTARLPGSQPLFISGTASIIGHQTVHIGNVVAQTHAAIDNIALVAGNAGSSLQQLTLYKVYVRHARDLEQVRRICTERLPAQAQVAYFVADICRSNLLMELEAMQH